MKFKVTDEVFRNSIINSRSVADALIQMGLKPRGGNYKIFYKRAAALGVSIEHFKGQGWLKGGTHESSKKITDEDLFIENYKGGVTTARIKERLLKSGHFEHRCAQCRLTEWLCAPIPLELEHINGNNSDNRKENLTLLCPNCHSLTPTYRGKNKKNNFYLLT